MGILQTVQREHVIFEPGNAEHRAAYWHLRTTGRQFEKLRFVVEEGFSSVLTMMQCKIADHFCRTEQSEPASVVRSFKRRIT